ncbi:cytochrome b pre-mRNA-processing protein 3 [Azospirillaceae bacterium]
MLKALAEFFRERARRYRAVSTVYLRIVEQSRRPEFFRVYRIPDTLDGRFDWLTLHVFLVLWRLRGQGPGAKRFGRLLFEAMVNDLDYNLREMGVADLGVGKRIQAMVAGVQGRISAYDKSLKSEDDRALIVALDNNLYGTVLKTSDDLLAQTADYLRRAAKMLAEQPLERVMAGEIEFPAPSIAFSAPMSSEKASSEEAP